MHPYGLKYTFPRCFHVRSSPRARMLLVHLVRSLLRRTLRPSLGFRRLSISHVIWEERIAVRRQSISIVILFESETLRTALSSAERVTILEMARTHIGYRRSRRVKFGLNLHFHILDVLVILLQEQKQRSQSLETLGSGCFQDWILRSGLDPLRGKCH